MSKLADRIRSRFVRVGESISPTDVYEAMDAFEHEPVSTSFESLDAYAQHTNQVQKDLESLSEAFEAFKGNHGSLFHATLLEAHTERSRVRYGFNPVSVGLESMDGNDESVRNDVEAAKVNVWQSLYTIYENNAKKTLSVFEDYQKRSQKSKQRLGPLSVQISRHARTVEKDDLEKVALSLAPLCVRGDDDEYNRVDFTSQGLVDRITKLKRAVRYVTEGPCGYALWEPVWKLTLREGDAGDEFDVIGLRDAINAVVEKAYITGSIEGEDEDRLFARFWHTGSFAELTTLIGDFQLHIEAEDFEMAEGSEERHFVYVKELATSGLNNIQKDQLEVNVLGDVTRDDAYYVSKALVDLSETLYRSARETMDVVSTRLDALGKLRGHATSGGDEGHVARYLATALYLETALPRLLIGYAFDVLKASTLLVSMGLIEKETEGEDEDDAFNF